MKIVFLILTLVASTTSLASSLSVVKDGTNGSMAVGAEVRYFKLENEFGKSQLFVLTEGNQGCRIPTQMLKDLGIDPIQFGLILRNTRGNEGVVLTCYMSDEQFNSRLIANRIEVTSWPRP